MPAVAIFYLADRRAFFIRGNRLRMVQPHYSRWAVARVFGESKTVEKRRQRRLANLFGHEKL